MAFHSLCQKIDVDSLRAKFSNLPPLPAMPQLKLPRSMPKLKTRKIFRSSRENIGVNKSTSLEAVGHTNTTMQQFSPAIPPAQFIDHTPQRISTISSLMYEQEGATYRSAHSIDDDYPSPRLYDRSTMALKPISPIRSIAEETLNNRSIVERIQKSYKNATEFRFKHIFSKKTVVRKDSIHVEQYVENYKEERSHNNHSDNRERAEDFRFQFKESHQKPGHSYSLSSNESTSSNTKNNNESDNDENNSLEIQHRKPGIAATRFSRVNNPPRRMSADNDDSYAEEIPDGDVEPRQSTLYAIKGFHTSHNALLEQTTTTEVPMTRGQIYKNRLKRFTKYATSSVDESGVESSSETAKPKIKATKERKRKAPLTPEGSVENNFDNKHENTFDLIKNNIKRIHRSIKNHQASVDESEEEAAGIEKPKPTGSNKIAARLRKLKSYNESIDNDEQEKVQEANNANSPIRIAINKKFSQFKKSLKKQTSEVDNRTGDEATPEKNTRSNAFIKNFRHIRSKKNAATSESNEIDGNNLGRKVSKFEQKFEHARKRTLKKVNDGMEKFGFSKKSQEYIADSNNIRNRSSKDEDLNDDDDDEQTYQRELEVEGDDINQVASLEQDYATRAIWTTKPILSDHTDEESDSETEYPRVLIHQDTSKLVLAVTRSPKPSSSPNTKIREIVRQPINDEKIVSQEVYKNLKKFPPPRHRRLSEGNAKAKIKLSSDRNSNSVLSIPALIEQNTASSGQILCRASAAGLVKEDKIEDPWKVADISKRDEQIYKTKSIDIFEQSTRKGGVGAAFENFDEELKNEPVVKISIPKTYSLDMESSEDTDAADDDNSSRITKISAAPRTNKIVSLANNAESDLYEPTDKQTKIFSNSRESLLANSTENINEYTEGDDDVDEHNDDVDDHDDDDSDADRPPSAAPSPPPTPISITPPPLPKRHTNLNETQTQRTPPLPTTKPPIHVQEPPKIPERTASMSRISKPLVKTSSLRLAYSEQVNPEDVGKVNKLISRFEQPKCCGPQRPRIIPRKKLQNYSDAYSENEETSSSDEQIYSNSNNNENNTINQINNSTENSHKIDSLIVQNSSQVNTKTNKESSGIITTTKTRQPLSYDNDFMKNVTNKSESLLGNSNSSSAYGSPLEFPSSLIGSPEITPTPDRKRINLQNRRTAARDDDVYLSFDSDEENSYYSISPAGSNRYIVDL